MDTTKRYRQLRQEHPRRSAAECMRQVRREQQTAFEKALCGWDFKWAGYGDCTIEYRGYTIQIDFDSDDHYWLTELFTKKDSRDRDDPRECCIELGERRDKQWWVLDETPKSALKYYWKQYGKTIGYEIAAAGCKRQCEELRRHYEGGGETEYVVIISDERGDIREGCGGIAGDNVEEFVWESISWI